MVVNEEMRSFYYSPVKLGMVELSQAGRLTQQKEKANAEDEGYRFLTFYSRKKSHNLKGF